MLLAGSLLGNVLIKAPNFEFLGVFLKKIWMLTISILPFNFTKMEIFPGTVLYFFEL